MNPQVSVILCSYNQGSYLPEAIESVLAQTFPDWELLLIDNGSTDSSAEIAGRYGSHPKIRLFLHRENRAISARFNEGVEAAKGKFISFLYSDDFYLPDKLNRQLRLFERLGKDFGVVYAPSRFHNQRTGREWTSPSMKLSGPALEDLLLRRNQGYPDMISPLTSRECFLRHPFAETIFAEGEAIFLRIALTHAFHMDTEPVAISRDTGENRGRAIPVNVEYHMKSLDRLRKDPAFDEARWGGLLRRHQAMALRDNAYAFFRMGGDRAWIRTTVKKLLAIQTNQLFHWKTILLIVFAGLYGSHWSSFVNRAIDKISRPPQQKGGVRGYGGTSGN